MSQDPELQKVVELRTPFPSAPRICGLVGLRASDAVVCRAMSLDIPPHYWRADRPNSMSSDIAQPEMLCMTSAANVTGVMSLETADRWRQHCR